MRNGQVHVFIGKVQKIEKLTPKDSWRVLLFDLMKENGESIIDCLWVDLPRDFEQKQIQINSTLRFKATVKAFSSKSYYDYHEGETVQLNPACKLANLSNIIIE